MGRVLVLFAHPAFEKSKVNRALAAEARRVQGVTFHDLYEAYPDFDVDSDREQKLLLEHETIILQHPFYWYSTPALVKQWFDLVLEQGWAYGEGGTALAGKRLISVITTGGREAAYSKTGFHEVTMAELLAPIRQTARLCRMEYPPPYVIFGAFQLSSSDLVRVARDYATFLRAIAEDTLDFSKLKEAAHLQDSISVALGANNPQPANGRAN